MDLQDPRQREALFTLHHSFRERVGIRFSDLEPCAALEAGRVRLLPSVGFSYAQQKLGGPASRSGPRSR